MSVMEMSHRGKEFISIAAKVLGLHATPYPSTDSHSEACLAFK